MSCRLPDAVVSCSLAVALRITPLKNLEWLFVRLFIFAATYAATAFATLSTPI
jgi:hypothetical protein